MSHRVRRRAFLLASVLLHLATAVDLFSQEEVENYLEDVSGTTGLSLQEELEDLETHPLSLNTAGTRDLLRIPWIDPALAALIVRRREEQGRYRRLDELLEIPGMSRDLYEAIVPCLRIERQKKGSVRIDTKRRDGTGDARISMALSTGWASVALKAKRVAGGESTGYSGYASLSVPWPEGLDIIAGDMYLMIGQGILAWPSFGALRSPDRPLVYPLRGSVLRPTTSSTSEKVLRGAGLAFSRRSLSAHLLLGRSGEGASRSLAGSFALTTEFRKLAKLEAALLSPEPGLNLASLSFQLTRDGIACFTEFAGCSSGGTALLTGLARDQGSAEWLFLYRHFSRRYSSPLGFDMALGDTDEGNLQAVYMGIVLWKGKPQSVAFYGDIGRRLYMGDAYTPARFEEFSLSLAVKPGARAEVACSGKYAREEAPGTGETEESWKLRWDTRLTTARGGFSILARWQVSGGGGSGAPWRASVFSLQFEKRDLMGFQVRIRAASAHCDDGGSVTLAEGGIPGRVEFVRFSGDEERYSVALSRTLAGGLTLRGKTSWTLEREIPEDRGLGLASWKTKAESTLQCDWRF